MRTKRIDRQKRALELKKLRDTRTPEQQLAVLDTRLGKDVGAKLERERLHRIITKNAEKNVKVVVEVKTKNIDNSLKRKKQSKR